MSAARQPPRFWLGIVTAISPVIAIVAALSSTIAETPVGATNRAQRLEPVMSWGYWLSSFEVNDVVGSPHDLMVVDNGVSAQRRFHRGRTPAEVTRMKQHANGGTRILLS